ncbi:ribosomal RNA large subunit methyltransferase J [Dictyocaulus viviparus]|uniref:Cap-specific mRNA (nucleoside-2'-O-)-methyltransferase 1 n=1 Tax=Dictyocaulus viviparus TaxID=29172 RepID=A0A0D8XAL5_DICVI|nr:ribosomal RNA large subunit methyltransferase J [Dictyocaulus viviparus]
MFAESSDSEPDVVPSGKDYKLSALARAKHEDLRETFEEEYDHYKGKRRLTTDSADGELSDSSTEAVVAKVQAINDEEHISKPMSAAERMMARMGYKEGKGLGKLKQGVVEPIALSTQRGRVGLGHEITKAMGRDLTEVWDESKEEKTIEESVYWLPECMESTRDWVVENLEGSEWIQIGKKKMIIDDETEFCDDEILQTLIKSKEVFDVIPERDLREARSRANPYETIGEAFFQNRAAMKVANLDRVFDFIISGETEEKLLSKNPLTSERPNFNCDRDAPLFYFADVCAGPGGFSEYMLWRKGFYNVKGFGFTLKGNDDFKLGRFTASSAHYFEPYYGKHGDGDVMNPDNIDSLEEFIMKGSAGLIYLMYVAYDKVALHKPHTSRPANSERYIICKGLRKNYSDAVRDYLKRLVNCIVNLKLDELTKADSSQDVISIVPITVLRSDESFGLYLTMHNERQAVRQSTYLQKYLSFTKNTSLIDKDQVSSLLYFSKADREILAQETLRDDCLKYWLVPNRTHSKKERGTQRQQIDPDQYFGRFTRKFYGREDFNARIPQFTMNVLTERSVKELKYAEFSLNILSNRATTQPELLISTGDAVFVWKKHWEKMENNIMRIPDRTVLLVERATTYKLVDKRLETVAVDGLIRILDAAVINGDDVSALFYPKRMAAAKKFCQALQLVIPKVRLGWGLHERYVVPPRIVTADIFTFDQLSQVRRKFSRLRHSGEEVIVFEENGYLLMCKAFRVSRILKETWKMGWSCSHSMSYAFCPLRPDLGSFFKPQWEEHECCSSFWESSMPSKQDPRHLHMQFIWSWENSLLDNYGPRVILEHDSHKSGPTVNSVLREVVETNEQCQKQTCNVIS